MEVSRRHANGVESESETASLLDKPKQDTTAADADDDQRWWDVRKWRKSSRLIALLCLVFVVFAVLVVVVFKVPSHYLELMQYADHHPRRGAIVVISAFALGTLVMLPLTLLCLGAGFAMHPLWLSILVSAAGALIGISLCFWLAHTIFKDYVRKKIVQQRPDWRAVDQLVQKGGWRVVLLLRLAVFPYNVGNYMFGVTNIEFWSYAIASVIGSMHWIIAMCYLGSLASHAAKLKEEPSIPLWVTLFTTTLMLTVVVGVVFYARKEIGRELEIEEERQRDDSSAAASA